MENKYRVVIIEDDELALDNLVIALKAYNQLIIEGYASKLKSAESIIKNHCPDLLFLDIELCGGSGLDLLQKIKDKISWNMRVVFYTAHMNYTIDAIRNSVFDVLLKPLSLKDLEMVMTRFFKSMELAQPSCLFSEATASLPMQTPLLMVSTIRGYRMLRAEQIIYAEYGNEAKQWFVTLCDQTKIALKRGVTAADIVVYSNLLIQINQQQILNTIYLAYIDDKKCILYPPFDNKQDMIISRSYFKAFQEKFYSL